MLQNAFKLGRKKEESRSSDGGDASLSGVYRVPVYRGRFCCYLTYGVVRKVRRQMRCGLECIGSPYIEVDFAVTLRTGQYVR